MFVTRHPGAIEWATRYGLTDVEQVTHFDPQEMIEPGDIVIGTLPINLVAEVNRLGGTYQHLTMNLPAEARGKELTAADMERYCAQLEPFFAASQDYARAEVLVGEWDNFNGEYGPERDYAVRSTINTEGVILKLLGENTDTRNMHIERIPGAWRINISMDPEETTMQVSLRDDGQILYE
ncbi:CRISPR-associated protein Csx16 [Acidithiobacillus ferrivorans]|nr:CRISPR-associated protein Csx16 [Acidithiobacillus ferrivorans]